MVSRNRVAAMYDQGTLRDEMVDNRLNLHDAIAEQADQTTIRKLAETQGERVAQMIMLHVETRDKIIGLLTPEQV